MNLICPELMKLLTQRRLLVERAKFDDYAESMAQERQRIDRVQADLRRLGEEILAALDFDAKTQEHWQAKHGVRFDGLQMGSLLHPMFSNTAEGPGHGASFIAPVSAALAAKRAEFSQQPPVPTEDARVAAPTSAPSRQPAA